RITRALRLKNRAQALTAASLLVPDWDGGTRIGEALGAFLAVPRFASLARGAAVVVLSHGLERRDPSAMRAAVDHLSRLPPRAAGAGSEAPPAGLGAAGPFLDQLGKGGSIESICAHVLDLARAGAA